MDQILPPTLNELELDATNALEENKEGGFRPIY
jgi:hypothetical protein